DLQNLAAYADFEQNILNLDRVRLLRQAFAKLNANQREVIEMAYYEGLSQSEIAERYELYALSALDPDEQLEFEQHLEKGCPICSAGIKRATASMTFLATMPEQVKAPARLRTRILASVGVEKSNRGWIATFAAAAVALLVVVIW